MTDYFATLDEPRRPWLDAESLKSKFHALSAALHPDRLHEAEAIEKSTAADRFTTLNAAYQCLREPKSRLQHLILLERGTKPGDSSQIPEDLLRLFPQIAALLRQADALIAEKGRTQSPVVKVQLMEKSLPCLDAISRLQSDLTARRTQLNADLKQLDSRWPARAGHDTETRLLMEAERLYHLYGFIDRWLAQLQDRAFQLTL